MQITEQAPHSLTLCNKAPKYRLWLGVFLAMFPMIVAVYSVLSQRRIVKCDRSPSGINCNYIRPNALPFFDSETIKLDNLKKTAVYQEIYVFLDGERIVDYYVLALADNTYVYIDNFRDEKSALAFKKEIEAFRLKLHNSKVMRQSYLDSLTLLAKNPKYYHFYLWTLLALLLGSILIYDSGYSRVYKINAQSGILNCKTKVFFLSQENDYILERIKDVFIEQEKDRFGVTYHRIKIMLTNGEKLTLNARLIEAVTLGRQEQQILQAVKKHLNHLKEKVLVS